MDLLRISIRLYLLRDNLPEVDTDEVGDGYHTFGELYAHRIELWIQLCKLLAKDTMIWRSRLHSDGSAIEGWFVLGYGKQAGEQITYHLPIERWDDCAFAETLEWAPACDGHSAADVLERLKRL